MWWKLIQQIVYIPIMLGVITDLMNRSTGNQPIDMANGRQNPSGPDAKDPPPHLCQLLIADRPLHKENIHMALPGHVNTHIPLAEVQLYVEGKVTDARAPQATPSHQQPGLNQADHRHYRDSKDEQGRFEEGPQNPLHLSKQHGTPALPYLENLSFNDACHTHNRKSSKIWPYSRYDEQPCAVL